MMAGAGLFSLAFLSLYNLGLHGLRLWEFDGTAKRSKEMDMTKL